MKNAQNAPKVKGKKTVFITGSTGRLGRRLVEGLLLHGYTVKALAEKQSFLMDMPSGIVPYVGDIGDRRILKEASEGADIAIHLAAIVSEYKAYTDKLMEVNVKGTENVIDACISNGVGRIIFSSTIDVYGRKRSGALTESVAPKPSDKYGYSKMIAEERIMDHKGQLSPTIFRMAAIYGPGFESAYFKVFRAIQAGKAAIIGDGLNRIAVLHVNDCVNAFMLAVENEKASGSIYNVSDGKPYTQKMLFDMAAEMLHAEKPDRHVGELVARFVAKSRDIDSDEFRFITSDRDVDISRIRNELGFEPKVSIKQGMLELINMFVNMKDGR
ncbi:MAG: NAD(P)-dependent oxidoreductase [Candidatus Micrarchaeota archaeon]|nr:NAD(P)-dependent oxidoreductase [Candidatus Micrarchaeota archaeon]MDE1824017.1 NAD(P)-dependent oxidoreductase [Candidatus Micrarchaeota archaeon]